MSSETGRKGGVSSNLELLSKVDAGVGERKRRFRRPNFTAGELRVLVEEVTGRHSYLAQGVKMSHEQRASAWQDVANRVSAEGVEVRTPEEVRRKWGDLKYTSKKSKVGNENNEEQPKEKPSPPRNPAENSTRTDQHQPKVEVIMPDCSSADVASDIDSGSSSSDTSDDEEKDDTQAKRIKEEPCSSPPAFEIPTAFCNSPCQNDVLLTEVCSISASLRQLVDVANQRMSVEQEKVYLLRVLADNLSRSVSRRRRNREPEQNTV